MNELDVEFETVMNSLYTPFKRYLGSSASSFLGLLVDVGGLAAAKALINSPRPSTEFQELSARGRGDLTVEALVVNNHKFHPLFTSTEIDRARKRLNDYRVLRACRAGT
jgi:hypothetical protein